MEKVLKREKLQDREAELKKGWFTRGLLCFGPLFSLQCNSLLHHQNFVAVSAFQDTLESGVLRDEGRAAGARVGRSGTK